MVLVKNEKIFHTFILVKIGKKKCFSIFKIEKILYFGKKNWKLYFPSVLGKIGKKTVFRDILDRRKSLCGL